MLIIWATSRRPRPPAVTRSAAESTPSAHGSGSSRNSAEHPDMREPSASGIEPISVPNGGYRTLTAGCGSRCAIGGAGSGGTSYSWEKTHDTVGWSSGPEILPQHPCASFLGNPRHRPGRNQADPRQHGDMTQFPNRSSLRFLDRPRTLSTPPSASTPTTRSRWPGTWNLFKASRRHARSPCPGGPICDSR